MNVLIWLLCGCFLVLGGYILITFLYAWSNHEIDPRRSLFEKWRSARNARLKWKNEHIDSFTFDFNHPDYQGLYNLEIGTQDMYTISTGRWSDFTVCSWDDYIWERKQWERQDTQ